jgi:hypothetical protein
MRFLWPHKGIPVQTRTVGAVMETTVDRVLFSPVKEVYSPGEVLTVAIFFRKPWVGEVEVGLATDAQTPEAIPLTVFARSNPALYEGQVHVRKEHVGACRMLAKFSGVDGTTVTKPLLENPIQVRPIYP